MINITLLEKCKSQLQWGITPQQSEWPSPKSLQTIHAEKGMEKRKPTYMLVGI